MALREKLGEGVAGELEGMQVVDDDGPALPSGPIHVTAENPPLTNTGDDMSGDPGLAVPVTPPRDYIEIESPREPATSRAAEPSDEDSSRGNVWMNQRDSALPGYKLNTSRDCVLSRLPTKSTSLWMIMRQI